MIGAGVLALPTVAEPVEFTPSFTALLGVWVYMAATGMLMSGKSQQFFFLCLISFNIANRMY